jgi:8-oxo-dGTP pyrophosphatase MutT (NUDIX family)
MTDRPERPGVPDDGLPLLERDVVRVVVQDANDAVLLLFAQDRTDPTLGTWWELPGGGIDDGETYRETAVRELREETGLRVSVEDIGRPTWRRDATFRYRGHRYLQHEVVVLVHIDAVEPTLDVRERLHYEAEDYPDFRWWPVGELTASDERFYPGRLPRYLPDLIAGRGVDEPFESFS